MEHLLNGGVFLKELINYLNDQIQYYEKCIHDLEMEQKEIEYKRGLVQERIKINTEKKDDYIILLGKELGLIR